MSDAFLPFALPDIGEDEITHVVETLRSGWVTTGPKTRQFESDFAAFLGGGLEPISVNSATAGLHLALEACGVGPGDEVITTPYTFTATAEVVRYLGADPVFVDIDPDTLNMDIGQVEAAITAKTRAIIPVHFAGLACDMDAVIALARRYNLRVIEDAAHAFPTTYGGRMIGTLESDATVFSFYATKTITTGEGGMIVTKQEEIANRCRIMRLHGISRDAFDRYTSRRPSWSYEVVAPGYKYNLSDLASALGIPQLQKAWNFQRRRQAMAARYTEELASLPLVLPPRSLGADVHAYHLYVIRLQDRTADERNAFIHEMAAAGIGCSVHFIPLHIQPYWRDTYSLAPSDFPEAIRAYESAVSLPLYTRMSDADQTRVVETVHSVLRVL